MACGKVFDFCGKPIECSQICNVQHSSGISRPKSNPIGVSLADISNNHGSQNQNPQTLSLTLD
jgi:hypothetical protein